MTRAVPVAASIVAGLVAYAVPAPAHMTAECLTSIAKMNMSSAAVSRLYSTWLTGKLAGWSPEHVSRVRAQLDAAVAKKDAALSNMALCCAPGRSRPMPGCDSTLDPNYDQYDFSTGDEGR